jgi:predicted transglutaminase-like cysteine proteinase
MNLHNFIFTKLLVFFIVLLALINFTKFLGSPNSIAGQTVSSKTLLSFKYILPEGHGLIDIAYVKGILNHCRHNIIQEEVIVRVLREWQNLILSNLSISDIDKLEKVNQFFNQLEFVNDIDNWGEEDYWATPVEFIVCQAGDCEDFSIAKYFTLDAMGVPEKKLSLTYVKALKYNAHHMVLTYYSRLGAEPLILDNIVGNVKPASERPDLIPIYSFNGTSLWLANPRGRGKLAGSSYRLKLWQDLLERMPEEDSNVYF